jgi:DNA-binding CsgD family transcriptional regulator
MVGVHAAGRRQRADVGPATAAGTRRPTARWRWPAVAVAARGRGPRTRPPTGWDSLTPAERDVVRLVAEGLTNPEIGRRLFVSRNTAKTHLSHVYRKLGVSNRTELARLAAAHLDTQPSPTPHEESSTWTT